MGRKNEWYSTYIDRCTREMEYNEKHQDDYKNLIITSTLRYSLLPTGQEVHVRFYPVHESYFYDSKNFGLQSRCLHGYGVTIYTLDDIPFKKHAQILEALSSLPDGRIEKICRSFDFSSIKRECIYEIWIVDGKNSAVIFLEIDGYIYL